MSQTGAIAGNTLEALGAKRTHIIHFCADNKPKPRAKATRVLMPIHVASMTCGFCQVNKIHRLVCQYVSKAAKDFLAKTLSFVCLCLSAAVPARCLVLYSLQVSQPGAVAEAILGAIGVDEKRLINFCTGNIPMPRLPNTWGVMIIHFAILVCCHCQVNKTIRLACQYAIHFGKEILIMHLSFVCLCLRAAVPASCLVLYSLQLKQLNAVAEEPLEVTVARGNYAINFYANNQPMPRVKMTQGVMLIQDAILACCHRQVSMKTSETLGHKDPLSKNEKSHNPLLGQRIGEASHPGPRCKMDDNQNAVLAILNPTAIRNKEKEFSCLMKVYNVDTFCCAETTATKETQDMMTKKLHELQLKTVWSDPVVQQRQRVNGQPCARGRAGGTSVHSKWPIRPACSHEHKPLCAADRVTHAIVRWGTMYVQIITIYGYTGGNAWHKKATNELFEHAIKMSHTTNMPTLFVGDFNMDVHDLEQFDSLRAKGYMSLQMLHEMHLGAPLPPTCKGATTPDTALVPPELCQRIKAIHVDAQCLFDAHAPVIVIFDVPKQDLFHMRMKTPKTWTEIPLDKQDLFHAARTTCEGMQPDTLLEWAQLVEKTVDVAIQNEHRSNPNLTTFKNLPKR